MRTTKKWIILSLFVLSIYLLDISNLYNSCNCQDESLFVEDLENRSFRSYEKISEPQQNLRKLARNEHTVSNVEGFPQNIPVVIVLCQKTEYKVQYKNSTDELEALYNNKFFRQVKVLLKSVAIATEKVSRVIIIANTVIPIQGVKKLIGSWPLAFQRKLLVEYHTFTPRKECMDKKLFKLCTSVRLFLHEILPNEDSIIYVDSDFIFLESPEMLARHFQKFNHLQFVGAAHNGGFYEFSTFFRSADYYYYGSTGISAGLLLMNLTRIKELKYNWTETVYSVCRSYKRRLRLFDQGVYNIIFSERNEWETEVGAVLGFLPKAGHQDDFNGKAFIINCRLEELCKQNDLVDNLYELDCRWSYNIYYCHERSICNEALVHGNIFAVHGPSNTFFWDKSKKLKVLFQVFENFKLGDSISDLISNLKLAFNKIEIIQPDDTDGCSNFTYLDKALLRPLMPKI